MHIRLISCLWRRKEKKEKKRKKRPISVQFIRYSRRCLIRYLEIANGLLVYPHATLANVYHEGSSLNGTSPKAEIKASDL